MGGGTHPFGISGAALRFEPKRRCIEREHIAFANANKHRMSWQAMATACGVNQTDLRRACDQAYYESLNAPVAVAAVSPEPKPGTGSEHPTIGGLRVLRVIHRGAVSYADIAELCSCSLKGAKRNVEALKACGWIAGHGNSLAGWVVTEAGLKALKRGLGR